jgi:hypothetical protein
MAKKKKNRRPKTKAVTTLSLSADAQFADEAAATLGLLRKERIVQLQELDGNVAASETTTTSKSQAAVMENHAEVQQDNYATTTTTTTPWEPTLLSDVDEPAFEPEPTLLETIPLEPTPEPTKITTPCELSLTRQMTTNEATPEPTPATRTFFETSLSKPLTCKLDPVVARIDRSLQPNNISSEPTLSEPTPPLTCKTDPVVAMTMTARSPQPVIKPNVSKDTNLAEPNNTGDIVVDHDFHHNNNPDPATHVYNGVKGVWAWGKEHGILVSPFFKITEGIANRVIGIVLNSDLQEVDENLVRPIFVGFDNHLLNPVIHSIVSTSLGAGKFIGKNVISPLVSLPGIVGITKHDDHEANK